MSTPVLIVLLCRAAVALVAGEITIRYAEWWWHVRSDPELRTKNVLIGIAVAAFCLAGIEFTYMTLRSQPRFLFHDELTAYSVFFFIFRLGLIASSIYLAIPVMLAHYKQNRRQIVLDLMVRAYLIVATVVATWELATIHYCAMGACK